MTTSSILTRRSAAVVLAAAAAVAVAACGSSSKPAASSSGGSSAGSAGGGTLRLGYFANVTHASAVVGVAKGYFQSQLGSTKLQTQIFNAGGTTVSALLAGSLDAA